MTRIVEAELIVTVREGPDVPPHITRTYRHEQINVGMLQAVTSVTAAALSALLAEAAASGVQGGAAAEVEAAVPQMAAAVAEQVHGLITGKTAGRTDHH